MLIRLLLTGIDIVANRLFGPVPRTITYVCLWEIHVGGIKASLSAYQATVFQAAVRALGINFTDALNAPADQYQTGIYPDSMSDSSCSEIVSDHN